MRISNGEKRSAMTGREATFLEQLLNRVFELQQADGVGDRGAVFSRALRHLLLREMKFIGEALEGVGLLDGIQILALKVFDQRHLERHFIGHVANDDGNAPRLARWAARQRRSPAISW